MNERHFCVLSALSHTRASGPLGKDCQAAHSPSLPQSVKMETSCLFAQLFQRPQSPLRYEQKHLSSGGQRLQDSLQRSTASGDTDLALSIPLAHDGESPLSAVQSCSEKGGSGPGLTGLCAQAQRDTGSKPEHSLTLCSSTGRRWTS